MCALLLYPALETSLGSPRYMPTARDGVPGLVPCLVLPQPAAHSADLLNPASAGGILRR